MKRTHTSAPALAPTGDSKVTAAPLTVGAGSLDEIAVPVEQSVEAATVTALRLMLAGTVVPLGKVTLMLLPLRLAPPAVSPPLPVAVSGLARKRTSYDAVAPALLGLGPETATLLTEVGAVIAKAGLATGLLSAEVETLRA